MERARIVRLTTLSPTMRRRLSEAQREAARVWTLCRDLHYHARTNNDPWPTRDDLQKATKGLFALHSQTVQMICHTFLANVEAAKKLKAQRPKMRYPYKDKQFYTLSWPAQTVCVERGRVVLPMGRGRASLVFHVEAPESVGACKLVWNAGYELHFAAPIEPVDAPPGDVRATVDLGEIHQAAVATNTGKAILISGRGIRTLKRRRNILNGKIARACARCKRGSKRWKRLQKGRRNASARIEQQIRDLRHKGTRQVVQFCVAQGVGTLYIGNPDGVQRRPAGRHHHQRMSQWEYGKDIDYLTQKCEQARIKSFTGSERGTSSRCPVCGQWKKPKGRLWVCCNRACGFVGHRDVVGATNMHPLAYGERIDFPAQITYRRSGPVRVRQRNEDPSPIALRVGTS